ncbi:26S protease regulatory subunit 10B [Ameca splendens]|uniref:26S protease regulatory subunit 10B n=1 Tax=Ameca splendens TaxID=208324 RepID=A0ABV0Z527_9TELE
MAGKEPKLSFDYLLFQKHSLFALQVIELPLTNPELFQRVGIIPPKGCLLYGPPGTGKTLLARAVASQLDCNFLKVVSSSIVDKYIGESARLIREMFNYARDHQPCIIFMDEIDAIGE